MSNKIKKTMKKREIIRELKKFIGIQELVCPHVLARFGEHTSWQFFTKDFLHTLLVVRRDILKVPMIINNHRIGGKFSQRGLRCIMCPIVKSKNYAYMSAHILGQAIDAHSNDMSAQQMRDLIDKNQHLLPVPIRMESNVHWLHIDVYDATQGDKKVTYFNP